jgi:fermentation-respiration switch protein FrsA (DUF1100 family)
MRAARAPYARRVPARLRPAAAALTVLLVAPIAPGASATTVLLARDRAVGRCVDADPPFGVATMALDLYDADRGRSLPTTVSYPTASDSSSDPACGHFPLVVVGHGAQGTGQSSAALHAFLTRAGYVLAAPTFPGGFDFDELTADVSFVITQMLVEDADPNSVISGLLERRRIGYIGTSMGGMIGLALFQEDNADPRVDAVVSKIGMAPNGSYDWAHGPALLMINGDADQIIPYSAALQTYRDARRPKALITLAGVGHDLNVGSDDILQEAPLGFYSFFLRERESGLRRVRRAVADSPIASMRARW